jgi:hypothetical protein
MVISISLPFSSPVITANQRVYRGFSIPGMLRVSFVPITRTASSSTAAAIEHSRYASELETAVSLFQPVNFATTPGGAVVVVLLGAVVVVLLGAVVVVLLRAVVGVVPPPVVVVVVPPPVVSHVGPVMMLLSSVTVPADSAKIRPFKVAPVCMASRPFSAIIVPSNEVVVARVAELPILHQTLQGSPPVTDEPDDVIIVDTVLKIQTPGPVVRVKVPVSEKELVSQ